MYAPDRKRLHDLAGGRCTFCKTPASVVRLEEAHIVAHEPNGPRGDDPLPPNQRDTYENTILACPNCHTMIDTEVGAWPVERLKRVKAEHERWIQRLNEPVSELAGNVNVRATRGDDVAGARVRRPTRIKPGTNISVDATGVRRVTGVEIGGPDG
jgi:hypothetical protein